MNIIQKDNLQKLMGKQKGLCVPIFMPTRQAGPQTRQNPIRFKNLLARAEKQLMAGGLNASEVEKFLDPAQRLLQNTIFWQHQYDGLAVFLTSDKFYHYRLPFNFEKLVVVANRFHIKPLLPLFSGGGRFYILALSQNEVRLLQGTRFSVSEIELEGLPKNIDEALRFDDPEKQLQFHTKTSKRRGKRAAMFHGHGVGIDESKVNILRYFRQIDEGLHILLKEERAPLVLAGVEYLFPIYKEASTYQYIVEEGIGGNPEELSPEELHTQAWSIVNPLFIKTQREAVAQYKQLAGTKRTSIDLNIIIPAAYHGRIEFLFVAVGVQNWGSFEPKTNEVSLHQKAEPYNEDLLDFSAIHTLLNGGTVFAMEPEKVPDGELLAAVFRY